MNNFLIVINKDNLVKSNTLINSLLRQTQEEVCIYSIFLDEISRLLLSKLQQKNVKFIPIHKVENKFKGINLSYSNSNYFEIYPFALQYLFEETKINDVIILSESLYFFDNPKNIFDVLNNSNESCSITHLGNILLTKIISNEKILKKYLNKEINNTPNHKNIYENSIINNVNKKIEINIFNSINDIFLYNFSDLEFLTQFIVFPSYKENKLLSDYEAKEIFSPYIDQLYISIAEIRNFLSDFSEGLFNDLDVAEDQSFIAVSSVIGDIDSEYLNLSKEPLNDFLYYFKPIKEEIDDNYDYIIEENQDDAIIQEFVIEDTTEEAQKFNYKINHQSKDYNMADPISFEVKFDDFTKSDSTNVDQNRIDSQIENLNIKLHNENTIKAEELKNKQNNSSDENKFDDNSELEESNEEYLLDLLRNNKFEIVNFDIDDNNQLPYYDLNLSIRIKRSETIDNQSHQSETIEDKNPISDFQLNEDPRLFDYTPAKNPQANIVWEGTQFVYHSLALINREISNNIIDSNAAELTIVPYEDDKFFDFENPKYLQLAQHDIRYKNFDSINELTKTLPYVWVRHQWPPKDEVPKGAKWVIMQPWEFSLLPKKFVEIFKQANEIWTPSNFCRKAFIASGLDYNKVQVIPNGIDPEIFTPFGDKLPVNTFKKFKFLFIGGTIYRKGIDVLLEAYLKAFTSDDDVCLIIKDMGGESFYNGQTAKERIQEIQNNPNAPEIVYIDDYLTESEICELYRSADVFVSPYRGEGFSLPTLEAMASGLPVIVTKNGATDDFVDETVGWQINSSMVSIGRTMDKYEMVGETELLEPNNEELAETLRFVATNPKYNFSKGVYAALRAREIWTWRRSTIKMFSRLDVLLNTKMAIEAENNIPVYNDSSLDFARGMQKFDENDKDEAFRIWDSIIDKLDLPEKYKLHIYHIKAYNYIVEEKFDDAINLLDEAVRNIIEHPDNNYLRALIYAKQGKYEEVYEILTNLYDSWIYVKSDSTLGLTLDDLMVLNADTALMQEDNDSALELYTQALKYNNENPYACYGSALCLKQLGDNEGAKNMFEWALKLNPDFNEAKIELDKL